MLKNCLINKLKELIKKLIILLESDIDLNVM
jgi:hypothetical protein